MKTHPSARLGATVLSLAMPLFSHAETLLPPGWDAALAGDGVMERLITITAPEVKGAHDAEMAIVGDRAYIVAEVNEIRPGESDTWPEYFTTLSIVLLDGQRLEKVIPMARSAQVFANATLPHGACFVPRIIQKDEKTLRCYFGSVPSGKSPSQMWYRDYDLHSGEFAPTIHKVKLKTAAGTFDFQPQHFHADAVSRGFKRPLNRSGFWIFDSFKKFDGKTYAVLNNFPAGQNALSILHDDFATFEVLGHYNEPQSAQLSESAVNRLPDGTWMAICRNDKGNYHFTTSTDGIEWSAGKEMPFVANGGNSKPTFDKFGGIYYLGWQERTEIHGVFRSVFNIDISRDGKNWERKYRFESTKSFQYPTFREHAGAVWLTVTQGDYSWKRKERIMFGKLEETGKFASQEGKARKPIPEPAEGPPVMEPGVRLFTDRDQRIEEIHGDLMGLPFERVSIGSPAVEITEDGTLYAYTPADGPENREKELLAAGFTKNKRPGIRLLSGEAYKTLLYDKQVKAGESYRFNEMVVFVHGPTRGLGARIAPNRRLTD